MHQNIPLCMGIAIFGEHSTPQEKLPIGELLLAAIVLLKCGESIHSINAFQNVLVLQFCFLRPELADETLSSSNWGAAAGCHHVAQMLWEHTQY